MWKDNLNQAYKTARKIVIAVVGVTVVLIGVMLILTPGPAFVVVPAGLAILGMEFAWARRWLQTLRDRAASVMGKSNDEKKK